MNEQANTTLVKQCYDAFMQGDIPRLMSMCDPDIDWELPEVPGATFTGKRHGHAEVLEFFRRLDESETITEFMPQEFIAQGERVVVLGRHVGTVKANGERYETEWAHLFTVRNGKVCGFHEFLDSFAASQAYSSLATGSMRQASMQQGQGQQPSIH
ncbi:nuclear transport factor 2 family protein [Noviherbaspirillum galbum]|uniref:Nuclear transport factor 2 family protein n=1 Tax=Noviherbaspirillum galbum TaxID=2709383 RepID=A0A6B3SPN6_9BURK|nr:nuclear transport factor 2 family protein [Noviherbaspirillum galbum]NEX61265.1 nuclear transport factor 2 family protein [Noviherbaspirillum galbum]